MTSKPDDFIQESPNDIEDTLVSLTAKDDASTKEFLNINELEDYIDEILESLPHLNRKKIRQELENMVVPIKQNPHTSDLNNGLAIAQGYKDRLAEIYLFSMRDYRTRNRCVEMLLDAYNTVSKASSADKRKGEASLRYAVKMFQLQASENFMKEVEHILANVKSAMDGISRQITIYDLQLKLGDIRHSNNQAEEVSGIKELEWHDNF